jgi:4-amino-4-deoxy-L-arabinose transferase-like glycosyltransferase
VSGSLTTRSLSDRLTHITPIQWLIVAAVFHVGITLTVFLIGHFRLLPNNFDQHGIAISFAIDGVFYRGLISEMAEALKNRDIAAWLEFQAPFHTRLYSFTFVFPGALVGHNILAAEPLNLICYLLILTFVYLLAKELFSSCTGLIAAGVVAVWPTLLIHTTQLLRDSMSIALMLALLWILTIVLKRQPSWRFTLSTGMAGIVLVVVFWLTRGNVWNIVFAALAITSVLLAIRMVRERKLLVTNLGLLFVVFIAVLLVPTRIESTTMTGYRPPTAVIAIPSGSSATSRSMWTRLITQIRARRAGFRSYTTGRASNIDDDVQFEDAGDIVRFLPRAAVIGFFAPFPRMWFESGTGGRAGRLFAGAETFVMYLLYLPAIFCVWRERHQLAVWLLFLVFAVGLIALGLVVVNAGALYRLRYVFWILAVIQAVRGIQIWSSGLGLRS